jgi:acid phosphatase family membrane protein YuiD
MPAALIARRCRRGRVLLLIASCVAKLSLVHAGDGLLGLDRPVALDDKGIWARKNQTLLLDALIVGEAGLGLWEGGETRLGHTTWQSIDATVVSGIAAQILKLTFSRERPSQTNNPDRWFTGHGNASFPSGEVTVTSAIVTPLLLEYGADHPAAYALEALPMYDAIARVKVHGHWQSDVIAGFVLGSATGYVMHRRQGTPLVLSVLPHGIFVGLRTRF